MATVCSEASLRIFEVQLWLLATRQHVSHGILRYVTLTDNCHITAVHCMAMIVLTAGKHCWCHSCYKFSESANITLLSSYNVICKLFLYLLFLSWKFTKFSVLGGTAELEVICCLHHWLCCCFGLNIFPQLADVCTARCWKHGWASSSRGVTVPTCSSYVMIHVPVVNARWIIESTKYGLFWLRVMRDSNEPIVYGRTVCSL